MRPAAAGRGRKRADLPREGAAFAVPLPDGRVAACRVLRANDTKPPMILVAGSAWIGPAVPRHDEPALRAILLPTHHSWQGQPHVLWVSEPPPCEFLSIGTIEPAPEERSMECLAFGGWASFAIQPFAQWRWEHDRDSVLAEDRLRSEQDAAQRLQAARERKEHPARVSLQQLANHVFFPHWGAGLPRQCVRESRAIMRRTVRSLLELGDGAPEQQRLEILRACIEAFNELDGKHRFIETVEREDICEEFEAIVHACGLGHHVSLADEWRDW